MKKKLLFIVIFMIIVIVSIILLLSKRTLEKSSDYLINLTDLTYQENDNTSKLKVYTQNEFNDFFNDYSNNNLPDVYITEFLFDGVSMHKTYDLDDFIEEGNDLEVKTLKITNLNINNIGNYELTGEIKGMISVNTNNTKGDINIILNGVNIDTDSKKVPAILVYNKDITYTDSKVTIIPKENSKNYIEGGKLKKVSLIGSDELDSYTNYYTNDNKTNYQTYTNYYGVYTKEEINNILFAKIQADNEDLQDGDPYYFYKGAGAISSDIDLYFEGSGYLQVTSKNKEGIETKGNLTFSGGIGDYVVNAEDDCLNTTTNSKQNNARNTLTIDVNTLTAIVDAGDDADEGDSIDSNGKLIINGGTIIAIAHPGQDAGIDSEDGIYINGGTVLATGDMYDEISSESKQNFIVLSFQERQDVDSLITVLDSSDNPIMSYKSDRVYTNLVYSSSNLSNGTYYLYKDGNIDGNIDGSSNNGLYLKINSYTKGTQLGYTNNIMGGMQGGNMTPPDMENNKPSNDNFNPSKMREKPNNDMTPPDMNNDFNPDDSRMNPNNMSGGSASNKEFVINGISNLFSGVGKLEG